MGLIDEEGNLFGVVNVIDAVVVLMILALLVGGAAFVLGADAPDDDTDEAEEATPTPDPDRETRYATIDLGTQPAHVADLVAEGDRLAYANESLPITDVYATPAGDDVAVTVRVAVEGELVDDDAIDDHRFEVDGEPLRVSQQLDLETATYTVDGTVLSIDREGETLPTVHRQVVLETTVSGTVADVIEEGDEYRLGDRTVATVTSVQSYPIGHDTRVHLGVEVLALDDGHTSAFGGTSVAVGAEIPIETDRYSLTGEVVRDDGDELVDASTTSVVTLAVDEPADVEALDTGVLQTVDGEAVVTITDVTIEGDNETDAVVTAELATHRLDDRTWFRGDPIAPGETLVLHTGDDATTPTVIEGTIVALEERD